MFRRDNPYPAVREREGPTPKAWAGEGFAFPQSFEDNLARPVQGLLSPYGSLDHCQRPARPAGRMASVISRKPNATAGAQDGP